MQLRHNWTIGSSFLAGILNTIADAASRCFQVPHGKSMYNYYLRNLPMFQPSQLCINNLTLLTSASQDSGGKSLESSYWSQSLQPFALLLCHEQWIIQRPHGTYSKYGIFSVSSRLFTVIQTGIRDALYHSLCMYNSEQTFLSPISSKIKIEYLFSSPPNHFSILVGGVLCWRLKVNLFIRDYQYENKQQSVIFDTRVFRRMVRTTFGYLRR